MTVENPSQVTASDSRTTPVVSVVLPVLNEETDIGRLLNEVLSQQAPAGGFEVLVVDGGSTDATREIVTEQSKSWPNLRLLDNPRRLSSAARNIGARAARGKYVLYLDGHCAVPRNDYLVRLVEVFDSSGAGCLSRPQPLTNLVQEGWDRAIARARHSFLGHNPGSDIYSDTPSPTDPRSAGAAYLRDVIDRLGGFDERFDACEDVEFNHRVAEAGVAAFRHPDLSVHYRPRTSLKSLFRQMFRYGRGRARLMARHPRAIPWVLVVLTVLVLSFVATLVADLPTAARIGSVSIVLYLVALLVEAFRLESFSVDALRVAAAFTAVHTGLLFGFWRGLGEFSRYRARMQVLRTGKSR